MRNRCTLMAWALNALLFSQTIQADQRNDIPDCYQYAGLTDQRPASTGRELVVVVDETTQLTDDLKKEALAHVLRFVQPGDKIQLYRFSAYLPDSHMNLEFVGTLQSGPTPSVRDNTGANSLKKLDQCLAKQQKFFQMQFAKKMGGSFGDVSKQIVKSEIVYSLKQIGESWKVSTTPDKVMFLISDMLENSDYTSFYQKNQIRQVDATKEMQKVEQSNLLASLKGVRIYIEAAGLVPNNVKYGYRSGKTMQSLETFWKAYFEASGATLQAFGTPALTQDLR